MSLLDKLNVEQDVEENEDFLPGDFTSDTGMYPMKIDMAFTGESDAGAGFVTVHMKEIGGGATHRETFYVTSRAGSSTYVDKRSGKKRYLPGMESMNQLCVITTGKKLPVQTEEPKVIKLWNFDEKKDLPTTVPALTDLIGCDVLVALTKKRGNKTRKVGNEFVNLAEERFYNETSKFLYPDGLTIAEKLAEQTDTTYRDSWIEKYSADYVQDKYETVLDTKSVAAASAAAGAANAKPVDDLFKDDEPDSAHADDVPSNDAATDPAQA